MVIVGISGGLANRMFQYAYYKSLLAKGINAKLDYQIKTGGLKHEILDIRKIFPRVNYQNPTKIELTTHLCGQSLPIKLLRRIKFISNRIIIADRRNENLDDLIKVEGHKFVFGTFCCEKYFKDIEDLIRNDFTFEDFEDEKNSSISQKMRQENSVSIHIRKGEDYTSKDEMAETCTVDYYRQAINYIINHIDNPVFYVFTDNPEWVKTNLTDFDYTLVDWNPTFGFGNHYDMQLQSYCKHNIIANSTYSWWGAWLNDNPDKIVVMPKKWFKNTYSRDLKYVPEGWIEI